MGLRHTVSAFLFGVLLAGPFAARAAGAPSPPTRLTATAGDRQLRLDWAAPDSDGGSPILDYQIEVRVRPQPYAVVPRSASLDTSALLTGLENDRIYDARVSAVTADGIGAPSDAVPAMPDPFPPELPIHQIISTGQSLSVGYLGAPALSVGQPYDNLSLDLESDTLAPLVETGVETMSSGMANAIAAFAPFPYQTLVTLCGIGSTPYALLAKGYPPYEKSLEQARAAKVLADSLGRPFRVTAVTAVHGESDDMLGTGDAYADDLEEWQADYQADLQAITGQADPIPLLTDQTGSWTINGWPTSAIPGAQLAAAERNPGRIVLVGPKYQFDYVDGVHLTNASYRWLGEYYAKVYRRLFLERQPWTPLSPAALCRQGNGILLRFHVPAPPLQFDTERVALRANDGFEAGDGSDAPPVLQGAEIVGPDTVRLALDHAPALGSGWVSYAWTGEPGGAGAHAAGSPRGNLRDSDATASLYGNDLYNWCVHFRKPLPDLEQGDVNQDGRVDLSDAVMALKAAVGLLALTPEQSLLADMNLSGGADVGDAALLLKQAIRELGN